MLLFFSTALWAGALLVCVHLYRRWNAYAEFRAAAIQHGCQRPRRYPHQYPVWGYDLYRERETATRRGYLMKLYEQHFTLYGKTFEEQFFDTIVINTMEPANIQQITTVSVQDWAKPATRKRAVDSFFGEGILSQDGPVWKHSRALIRPTFARTEVANLTSLSCYTGRLLELIPRDGSSVDLQPLLRKFFLDVSTDFLFGESVDSLLPNTSFKSTEFIKAFDETLAGIGRRRRAGMFYFLYTFDRRWKEAYTKVHAYIDNHIKRVLKQTGQDRQGSFEKTVHSDCLESSNRFILLEEMAKQIRDPLELRYQILHVFVTARDTVAILLGNTLFHLARNPHIWTDLRRIALTLDPSHLTYEVIQSLVLFRNVLFETIRVQGPSGRIVRSATRNTILPVGGGPDGRSPVFVAKGTLVAMQTWALNHDKDIWGEDTDDFKPQRWAEARSPDESNPQRWVEKRSAFEFVPFLAGPRMCPAHQQVMTQATYVLVRLVTEFASIENRDPVQEYVEWSKMLTESRNGVKIALSPASGAE